MTSSARAPFSPPSSDNARSLENGGKGATPDSANNDSVTFAQDASDPNIDAGPDGECHQDCNEDNDSDDDLNTEYYDVQSVAARTDTTGLQPMYGATWRQAMVLTANSGFASGTPRTEGWKGVREGREPELGLARLKGVGRTGNGPAPVPQEMIDALRRAGLVKDDEQVTRLENFTLPAELGGQDIRADGQYWEEYNGSLSVPDSVPDSRWPSREGSPETQTKGKSLREQLTTYEAYSISPGVDVNFQETDGSNDGPSLPAEQDNSKKKVTWTKALRTQAFPPQDSMDRTVERLNKRSDVSERLSELGPNQRTQVMFVLDDKLLSNRDEYFDWEIAQIERNLQVESSGKKKTANIVVYLRRTPRPEIDTVDIIRRVRGETFQEALGARGQPSRPQATASAEGKDDASSSGSDRDSSTSGDDTGGRDDEEDRDYVVIVRPEVSRRWRSGKQNPRLALNDVTGYLGEQEQTEGVGSREDELLLRNGGLGRGVSQPSRSA